jgi:translocation and assembly module TamB
VQGSIRFDADVNLADWQYLPANAFSVHLDVARMPIDQLTRVARISYPISGVLSAQLSLHGSELNPVGTGSVHLTQARFEGIDIPRVSLDFQGTGDTVHSTASASLAGGDVNGVLTYYPRNQGYITRFEVRQMHLGQIEKARALHLSGLLSASATGHGTLKDPQLSASASIPQLEVHDKTVSGISAQLEVANQNATFSVNSTIAQSFVEAHGTVALTGDEYATINLDSKGIALHALLTAYLPAGTQDIQGELELHAAASGPIKRPREMQAQLQIPVLTASYKEVHIAAARPIVANYRNAVIRLEPTEIKGTGTDIRIEGSIPLEGQQPANFTATGGIDLSLLHMLDPDLTSSGRIELDIHGAGLAGVPGIHGQARLVNAGFTSLSTPMGVEGVNGVFAITDNEIQIENFAGHLGGGDFTAAGTVGYRPTTQFNVTLKANHVRLLYPEGLRTILQSDLLLAGNTQSANLTGRVLVDSVSFAEGFDLASFMSQTAASSGASPNQGFAENLRLNIALQSASDVGVMSSEVSLQGSLNLKVVGTAANPVILGRADITHGELFFMGRRYQVQRGLAQFSNPAHTEPVLNFMVTTTVNQYDISLSLIGPLERLRTHYVSDPPLPPVDIINLLARGQTTEEGTAAPANMGANQLIASGVASQVSGGLQRLAGISSLQIDPLIGGNNRNPGARLSIQQRVTRNFFFTYSTDVTSTQDQIVQGEYQLTRRWSISAVRDQYGNIGIDAKFHKTF